MIYPVPKPVRAKRTRAPLRPKTRIKKINKKRGGHAFPKNVDEPYREWIRTLPCILSGRFSQITGYAHMCWNGDVQCCHVKTRGSGGKDRNNCFPGCASAHDQQGLSGTRAFEERWGVSLKTIARQLTEIYEAEKFPCP